MSFNNDLTKQINNYILFPENIIDEVIRANCKNADQLSESQKADICAIRRNSLVYAKNFNYSLEELDLIIATIDSNPNSSFARLRDAVTQIEFILGKDY